jgi:hypothetical protein
MEVLARARILYEMNQEPQLVFYTDGNSRAPEMLEEPWCCDLLVKYEG